MANLPVTIFKFAMSPFANWQQLAWAGVFLITLGVLALNILARVLFRQKIDETPMNTANAATLANERIKMDVREPELLLREVPGAEEHHAAHPREEGHGLHRPVRVRQVHAAARVQPDVRALPRAARRRRGQGRRREHPDQQGRRRAGPRQDRHDLPEADAVPDVDLRQHRVRRAPVREPVALGHGRPRGVGAEEGGAVERGQGQAEPDAARACPAASSSGCASRAASR